MNSGQGSGARMRPSEVFLIAVEYEGRLCFYQRGLAPKGYRDGPSMSYSTCVATARVYKSKSVAKATIKNPESWCLRDDLGMPSLKPFIVVAVIDPVSLIRV